jgi:hypothetical protein
MNIATGVLTAQSLTGWFRTGHASRRTIRVVPATQGPLTIDKGATLVVERPLGTEVTCVSGSLWITHDGDVKDILIEAGDTYRSDRFSRMLVHGLGASTALVA